MSRERLMSVLIGPHVSEKSARVSDGANQFAVVLMSARATPSDGVAVMLTIWFAALRISTTGRSVLESGNRMLNKIVSPFVTVPKLK